MSIDICKPLRVLKKLIVLYGAQQKGNVMLISIALCLGIYPDFAR